MKPWRERPSPAAPKGYEEVWTGDYILENEWQSFRTRKDRSSDLGGAALGKQRLGVNLLSLIAALRECPPGRRKLAVKVVDIFGNDTMTIVEVTVGGKR